MNKISTLLNNKLNLHQRVEDGLERELKRQKKAGKKFLSDDEIDNLIDNIIKEELGDEWKENYTNSESNNDSFNCLRKDTADDKKVLVRESKLDLINFNGHQYYITDDELEKGDLYINYSNYKRGVDDKNLKYIIGTVMEIGSDGTDIVIYAEEMKSDLLSSCKKLVLKA